jgi:phosphomannomutase/phosphoglucomutase
MKKLKTILYIIVPIAVIVLIIKEFLLKIKINTQETIQIGIGITVAMWVGFIFFQRFLSKKSKAREKNISGCGFQIIHKNQPTEPQTKTKPPKFYSTGAFRIVHKGQRPDDESDDRLFRVPIYRKRSPVSATQNTEPKLETKAHFGTAGIRGLTNIEITPLLVLKMSEIYGAYLSSPEVKTKLKIAVGYDSRYGAEMLTQAAISGLNSAGVHTINCGCITTGGLASYIICNKLDGGILITGSHTPYNMTGFIILNSDGSYLDMEHSRELENRFDNYERFRNPVKPENIGNNQEAHDPFGCYKSFLLERVDSTLIKSKQYRVLVDPANGPATLILPDILKELSCSVFLVNEQLSAIPNRPSEPRAKNLVETAAKVKEYQCDLGIATDVDADRVLFIDAEGKVLSEDLVGAIFARSVISSSKTCVTPINSSFLIEDVISNCGGRLEYCRIGQPETIKAIKQFGASFSYEESGKYYFCKDALWPDALLSSLKLLEIMTKHNKPLAQIASEFPQFYQVKHTLPYDSLIRDGETHIKTGLNVNKIFEKTQELWKKEYLEGSVKDVTIDGLKRVYNDKSWLLIRKSGTEPLIRIYADAPTCERAEQLVKQGEELVKKAIKGL